MGMKRPTLLVQAVKALRLMPLKQKGAYGHHSPSLFTQKFLIISQKVENLHETKT